MAAGEQEVRQKITLDTSEAKRQIEELRAAWNALKAEMGGSLVGVGAGTGPGSGLRTIPIYPTGASTPGGGYEPPVVNGNGGSGGGGYEPAGSGATPPGGSIHAATGPGDAPWVDRAALREAVRDYASGTRSDYRRGRAVNRAIGRTQDDVAWMRSAVAETQAMPEMLRSGPTGAEALAPIVGFTINEEIDRYTDRRVTGRRNQLYDHPWAIAGAAALAGLAAGGPIGAIAGGAVGYFGASKIQNYAHKVLEPTAEARLLMDYYGGTGRALDVTKGMGPGEGGDLNLLKGTLGLQESLAAGGYGTGSQGLAAYLGRAASQKFVTTASVPNPIIRDKILQDLPKGIDAFTSPLLFGPYNEGNAAAIMEKDFDAGAAYMRLYSNGTDPSVIAERLAGVQRASVRAQTAATAVGAFSANVAEVTARGGTASDITTAMGGQSAALLKAAEETQKYIRSLEAVGVKTEEQRLRLEQANVALAGTNAAIAQLATQAVQLKSAEAVDISGTSLAVAAGATSLAEMRAGRNASPMAVYGGLMDASAGNVRTLEAELKRPGLLPEDRRRIERELSAARVENLNTARAGVDFAVGRPARIGASDAALSAGYGAMNLANESDPVAAAATRRRIGAAGWSAASLAMREYEGKAASGLFDAETLADLKARAVNAQANAFGSILEGSRFSFTPTQTARLALLEAGTASTMRNEGSGAAAGLISEQMALYRNVPRQARSIYESSRGRIGETAAAALRDSAIAYANRSVVALQEARGQYIPSASLGMESDAARFEIAKAELGPFFARNPVGAYKSAMGVNARMLDQARRELADPTLDAAARRSRTQQIQGLELEQMELQQKMNFGWEGRLMTMASNMPSFSASYAGSYRDAILFGSENRVFGAATRAGAERNRDGGVPRGSDATFQPGNAFAQGVAQTVSGRLDIVVHLPDGQSFQRQVELTANTRAAARTEVMDVMLKERR